MEAQDSAVITDETEASESEEPVAASKEEDILEVLKGSQSAAEFARKSMNYWKRSSTKIFIIGSSESTNF